MTTDHAVGLLCPDDTLQGHLDVVDWEHFHGWAFDPARPDEAVALEIIVDGAPPLPFLANLRRDDLVQAGIGTGCHAFFLHFSRRLDASVPHHILVRRARDGAVLPNAPALLAAAPGLNLDARRHLEASIDAQIAAASRTDDFATLRDILLRQTDRVLQATAEIDSDARLRSLFQRRWAETVDGAEIVCAPPDRRPKVLYIGPVPLADEQCAWLAGLRDLGYHVAVASPSMDATVPALPPDLSSLPVYGAPLYFTVEDVLRRHANSYSVILLHGAFAAAAYALLARSYQRQARILAWLEEGERDATAGVASQLLVDATISRTDRNAGASAWRAALEAAIGRPPAAANAAPQHPHA